jgi:hypothetical protein
MAWPHERRLRADRRLNNISVELIPFNEVYFHPGTRDAFCRMRRSDGNVVQLREKELREKAPPGNERREKEPRAVDYPGLNIFRRSRKARIESRKGADRRTQNIKQPFNRRVRPDRRLNNISVEWIQF